MGQDIHSKTLIYSKVEKRYIDSSELFGGDRYSEFPEFYSGRNYALFSIFGSTREDYPEIDDIQYGIPDVVPKTLKVYFDKFGGDYHTFSWFYYPTLISSINYYIEKLHNPSKFLLEGEENEKIFDIPEWKDDKTYLITTLIDIRDRLKNSMESVQWASDIIDVDKTIMMIWFDN